MTAASETGPRRHPPPDVLGRFENLRRLASGTGGSVHLVRDPVDGRQRRLRTCFIPAATPAWRLRVERAAAACAAPAPEHIAAVGACEWRDETLLVSYEQPPGAPPPGLAGGHRLPLRAALELGLQIARGLEQAHQRGLSHAALGPSAVHLNHEGVAELLDFGLPELAPESGSGRYASPELERGEAPDERSDVWSFGCLLYELLAGRPAFSHGVDGGPAWEALPARLDSRLLLLLQRCLRAERHQRLQSMGDARLELAEALASMASPPRPQPGAPGKRLRMLAAWAAAALACALAAVAAWRRAAPGPAETRSFQVALDPPPGHTLFEDFAAPFALAPDGASLAFLAAEQGRARLFVQPLDGSAARLLVRGENPWQPFFSPDGRWLAYFDDRRLLKVPVAGGTPLPLAELVGNPRGGTWAADGTLVVAPSQTAGLLRVRADGTGTLPLTQLDQARDERSHRWPQALPGGRAVLFTVDHEGRTFDEADIEVVELASGRRRKLLSGGSHARYVSGGYLLFAQAGRALAVRFDLRRLEVAGPRVAVLPGVRYDARNGGAPMALADDGTLLYLPGLPETRDRHLTWADPRGHQQRLPGAPRPFEDPRLDPRAARVALRMGGPEEDDLWIQDAAGGTLTRLTHGLHAWRPVWTRDGRRLVAASQEPSGWRLVRLDLEGGAPEVLLTRPQRLYPCDWSPDGRVLVVQELTRGRGWDLLALEVDGNGRVLGEPRALAARATHETNARFSPDGRWLAYESDELDSVADVYAQAFGHGGARIKVSAEGGRWPLWGADGQIYYWHSFRRELRRVRTREEEGELHVSDDVAAWSQGLRRAPGAHDLDPATGRLLYLEEPPGGASPPPYRMTLFSGWAAELARRMAAAR